MGNMIVEGIKNGKLIPIFCEPLAEFRFNLAYCPYREECEELANFYGSHYELICDMHCNFCKRKEWIFIGAYTSGLLLTATIKDSLGKEILEIMQNRKKAKESD